MKEKLATGDILAVDNQIDPNTGTVTRGWLGISTQDLTADLAEKFGLKEPKGVLVADITKGGPADRAGIERGDVILAFGDMPISDAVTLRNIVADTPVGQELDVTVWRRDKRQKIRVKIGNLEEEILKMAASVKKRIGLAVEPVTPRCRSTRKRDGWKSSSCPWAGKQIDGVHHSLFLHRGYLSNSSESAPAYGHSCKNGE